MPMTAGLSEAEVREIVREELEPLHAFRNDILERFAKAGVLLRRNLKSREDTQDPVEQHPGRDIGSSGTAAR